MKNYILSIDQGTTGSTVLIFDREGKIVSNSYSEFTQHYPAPGWVEHDPEEIWSVTLKTIKDALAKGDSDLSRVQAVGITNQRETTVVWDRETGRPVMNAIVWQCRRTSGICDRLKENGLAPLFRKKTGLVLDAYFSGTKIKWILDRTKGSRTLARKGKLCFGTIDSWLIWKLTGGRTHATDHTNASRTLIYNIEEKKWDKDLLKILDIPERMLPDVRSSSGFFGEVDPSLGLGGSPPISGVAGDQQAALYGQGCWERGSMKNTYGTGCFVMVNTGSRRVHSKGGLLTTLCCDSRGRAAFALEGSIFIAGAAIQWLRDGLKIIKSASETEEIARNAGDTGGVYLVPAFAGLGAPYWDMEARGAITGITRGTNTGHIVRAAIEAIAYQTRDVCGVIEKDTNIKIKELRVDGGAVKNNFLMQFQADILGARIDRPEIIETTALGAAFLAGLGSGFWKDPEEITGVRRSERVFHPALPSGKAEKLYSGWLESVKRIRSTDVRSQKKKEGSLVKGTRGRN